ncbi:MAG: hydroxymethylbilane synthase, partial [Halobacteria archaeon]|nr:hydroxymethylbilane synthase [Halobacteria archaeon]
MKIRLGTRGSDLALKQTQRVADSVSGDVETEAVVVETAGDRSESAKYSEIGGQGVFVREIDARVVDGEVDAAVHSMKDMPTDRPEELEVAAVLERDTPYDVLVTQEGQEIDELDEGAVVGTSSMRRRAQLRRHRDDLEIEPLRGNVDTRVGKMAEGDYDAVVLSGAGLERLGDGIDVDYETQVLHVDRFVPSANQGIIAVVAVDGS